MPRVRVRARRENVLSDTKFWTHLILPFAFSVDSEPSQVSDLAAREGDCGFPFGRRQVSFTPCQDVESRSAEADDGLNRSVAGLQYCSCSVPSFSAGNSYTTPDAEAQQDLDT